MGACVVCVVTQNIMFAECCNRIASVYLFVGYVSREFVFKKETATDWLGGRLIA